MTVPRPNERVMDVAVYSLVAAHAATRPDHVAVVHRQTQYTYAELDARAGRLGNALRSLGVVEGDRIGVCLEPELDVPAVLLAILKVGAAYVPLDPQYPAGRITEIIEDVGPRVIVSRSALRDRMAGWPAQALLLLDEHATRIAEQPPVLAALVDDPARIATIFFTSGTTGRPKGARAAHEQLAFYARAARNRFELAPADVVPTIARFSFSISIFELLVPLTAGATVHVLDRDVVMDPARMATALEDVTLFHMGPSLLRGVLAEIARAPRVERYARVRHASSGGDMIPPQVLASMRDAFPAAEVFVLYGCSEISCMGTWYAVPRTGAIERTYVGRAFDELQLLVLDDALQPVAAGTPGEVFFAGPGLIVGYLDRPELDAERFVTVAGTRYYRTGDVGRWHEAHGLELLGRADFQIKVRGMRVESAEVEYHLRQVPGIRDAAVALRERRGEMVLAAFVVRSGDAAEDADALSIRVRRLLSDRVPDYMVPSTIVELAQLPLNHNLKLDRRALPEITAPTRQTDARQAPRTETEQWLATIWCVLLGRASVGRRQNFFELGGDSLLGLQLILRVQREKGVRLDGMDILRESLVTLASIVDAATGADNDVATDPASATLRTRSEGFYFGPEQSLYGHLMLPAQTPGGTRAVLVCSPIGHEDVRANFVVTLLMRKVAEMGLPVMRFDFYGTRDSLGETSDGDLERWRHDLLAARAELTRRTGASEVLAIGLRLGGTLLANSLSEGDWASVVLIDPVLEGRAFLRAVEAGHAAHLASPPLRRFRLAMPAPSRGRELLGFTWSPRALEQLEALHLNAPSTPTTTRIGWITLADPRTQEAAYRRVGTGASAIGFEPKPSVHRWDNHEKVLELMPDGGLVDAILEMMDRLR